MNSPWQSDSASAARSTVSKWMSYPHRLSSTHPTLQRCSTRAGSSCPWVARATSRCTRRRTSAMWRPWRCWLRTIGRGGREAGGAAGKAEPPSYLSRATENRATSPDPHSAQRQRFHRSETRVRGPCFYIGSLIGQDRLWPQPRPPRREARQTKARMRLLQGLFVCASAWMRPLPPQPSPLA